MSLGPPFPVRSPKPCPSVSSLDRPAVSCRVYHLEHPGDRHKRYRTRGICPPFTWRRPPLRIQTRATSIAKMNLSQRLLRVKPYACPLLGTGRPEQYRRSISGRLCTSHHRPSAAPSATGRVTGKNRPASFVRVEPIVVFSNIYRCGRIPIVSNIREICVLTPLYYS